MEAADRRPGRRLCGGQAGRCRAGPWQRARRLPLCGPHRGWSPGFVLRQAPSGPLPPRRPRPPSSLRRFSRWSTSASLTPTATRHSPTFRSPFAGRSSWLSSAPTAPARPRSVRSCPGVLTPLTSDRLPRREGRHVSSGLGRRREGRACVPEPGAPVRRGDGEGGTGLQSVAARPGSIPAPHHGAGAIRRRVAGTPRTCCAWRRPTRSRSARGRSAG